MLHTRRQTTRSHLVNSLDLRNIGNSVGSVFIFVGFNLRLENKMAAQMAIR